MKILIVGAGGTGSYLADELYRLIMCNQINTSEHEIHFADFDTVEQKNILYQNFKAEHVLRKKSDVIAELYSFYAEDTKIESTKQLAPYDLIVCCADNSAVRKLIAESGKPFIDLRAEGRAIAFFTKRTDSFDVGNGAPRSCQLPFELAQLRIQNGNKIIASIGSQLILNYIRGEKNPDEFIYRF